jgi:hypothetical protein
VGTQKIRLLKELNEMEFLEAKMRGLPENLIGFLLETNLAAQQKIQFFSSPHGF